jgi:prolyl-tRNA editing enzyme YbaK/EbsC (Cys-tRNA(Pro) deacylase)
VPILETEASTATVELAARAHGVEPGRIAKTLAFRLASGQVVLLVARGDARIDNHKFKVAFGKGRMLPPDEVGEITGHPVGGVCPFGLAQPLPVWLDVSHSAVRLTPAQLEQVTGGSWADVCALPPPAAPPPLGHAGLA